MTASDREYEERMRTALWLADLKDIVHTMEQIEKLPVGLDGVLTYRRDDGEQLAEFWFDYESETWLCNFLRGSGA